MKSIEVKWHKGRWNGKFFLTKHTAMQYNVSARSEVNGLDGVFIIHHSKNIKKEKVVMNMEVLSAFEKEKDHLWHQVKVRFSWVNMEGEVASTYLPMRELYKDWQTDCDHCPDNDTPIFDLKVGTTPIPNEVLGEFRFEELMGFIEQTWPRKKRGRPSDPEKTEDVKEPVSGRKRGRPSKKEKERMLMGFGR